MVTPELPTASGVSLPVSVIVRTVLTVTGWAVTLGFWLGLMAWIAIEGNDSPMTQTAFMGVFMGGVLVAVLALVVKPIIARLTPPEAPPNKRR